MVGCGVGVSKLGVNVNKRRDTVVKKVLKLAAIQTPPPNSLPAPLILLSKLSDWLSCPPWKNTTCPGERKGLEANLISYELSRSLSHVSHKLKEIGVLMQPCRLGILYEIWTPH